MQRQSAISEGDKLKWLKNIVNIIRDPDRDFKERRFLLLTYIVVIAVFIVLVGDIFIDENWSKLSK